MATTNNLTIKSRRLGAELRKLRERAGLSSTAAAALLGVQQARVSMIEAGRYSVSGDRVRAMARSYGCVDHKLVDALADMTGGRTRGWWDEYREHLPASFADMAELEHRARALRVALVIHIPGLLQTVDYARAVIGEVAPPLRAYEVEHRLSHRMKRQAILYGDSPVPYTAIIHEAALRMEFGGLATVRAQLEHLIAMSEMDSITVRVIPFAGGTFPGTGQSFDYVLGPVSQLDTVQLDSAQGTQFMDAEAELAKYRAVLERMETTALDAAESRDFIHRIVRSM
ncbi:helix-turn-helix domain-containing protein [Streptomyces sparsogenes]|uniref:Helix-turn-helix domain-containing protein n=1 Tax=Streptomyces sparsogenes DSM 40356 TaxID=1331668 RepID=A0A1R1S4H1_9ACTN|nr:helix-turn-helix transcriptional regulator [Streptomyces sparsogenes]OMI33143.1 helix-turn-helix domain-containing protein [Streptomyces sparsogenes DSM 40356]